MTIHLSIAMFLSITVHPPSRSVDGDDLTRRQRQDYYNSTSIPCPADGIFPTRRRQQDFFAAGISPLGEMSVRPANTIFFTRKHQCRHAHMLFLDRHTGVELSAVEFFHSESPLCCKDFFLSEPPFDAQLMGFSSL